MLRARVIPCLLLHGDVLVKTIRFKTFNYIGDPINTVRIFNELEVDELCFLDIEAAKTRRSPNFELLNQIANECFMPLSYGGGLTDIDQMKRIFGIGFEKVVINSFALESPAIISKAAEQFGSQSIVGSIDIQKNWMGKVQVVSHGGTRVMKMDPVDWAKKLEALGVGELLVTSIDREGTWSGYDVDVLRKITSAVSVPVIANGGAGSIEHIGAAVTDGGASAASVGSMVVYQAKDFGVLINFPDRRKLDEALGIRAV